jgi:dynamin 1-like protein
LLLCGVPAGKEEDQLRRLLNENEEVARQRDSLQKRLTLMERAAREIMSFRV